MEDRNNNCGGGGRGGGGSCSSRNAGRDHNNNLLSNNNIINSSSLLHPKKSDETSLIDSKKPEHVSAPPPAPANYSPSKSIKPILTSLPVLCSILWILFVSRAGMVEGIQQQSNQESSSRGMPIIYHEEEHLTSGPTHLSHLPPPPPSRRGRVMSSPLNRSLSDELKTSASSENGSSRKASPDVQDIIDGIVKLLGGKVHNGGVQQPGAPTTRVTTTTHPNQQPHPLFNPINHSPFFHPNNQGLGKPSRINNRGPVLPGNQQPPPQHLDSFEAIPLEAINSEFNLNKSNWGPPFPISGAGGGVISPNVGATIDPPYMKGVPLPEMLVPQQQHPPPQNTRYNLGLPQYNPFGFQNPSSNPNIPTPSSMMLPPSPSPPPPSQKPTTLLIPFAGAGAGGNSTKRAPIVKFPSEEDDEADDMKYGGGNGNGATLSLNMTPPPQISPTPTTSEDSTSSSSSSSLYPTLLLSSNRDNGLVELVTTSGVDSINPSSTSPTTPTPTFSHPPIFTPNNPGGSSSSTVSPSTGSTSTISSGVPGIHPTPPLRPGLVLNDNVGKGRPPSGQGIGSVEVVTADEGGGGDKVGEIFDVTVTAKQSYGGSTAVPKDEGSVITAPQGTQQFVSIDGKRTYFNLHPSTAGAVGIAPTSTLGASTPAPQTISSGAGAGAGGGGNIGVGSVGDPIPLLPQAPGKTIFNSNPMRGSQPVSTSLSITGGGGVSKTPTNLIRRPLTRRPSSPPVRIDTCIVGDDSTCASEQAEVCRTEHGVSSCACRSGYARRRHREPCRAIISLVLSLKLDKFGDKKLTYDPDYFNPNSETYQKIEWETIHALDTSLGETTLAQGYVGSKLDAIGFDGKHAVVNSTVLIQDNPKMPPAQLKKELQKQMIQVLTKHRNNFGKSQLWVEGPISAVAAVADLDECEDPELNDCNAKALCINTFGSFECKCEPGYGDPHEQDPRRSGRRCDSCSGKQYCNGRGECFIENGQKSCRCAGNYYGSQCDVDGEVLAVAIGASVSAVLIIALTLFCLCMWSRKWKKEEQKALMSRTLFGGMANQALSYIGGKSNPYQQHVAAMDERLRWAAVAEAGNIYVQNDPLSLGTCPVMGMGGPPAGPSHMPSSPMIPARRSAETVDTIVEELQFEERGKRPRSRASQFQGSIYYDLDPEQTEIYASRSMMHFPPPAQFCVPLTHYPTNARGYYS